MKIISTLLLIIGIGLIIYAAIIDNSWQFETKEQKKSGMLLIAGIIIAGIGGFLSKKK